MLYALTFSAFAQEDSLDMLFDDIVTDEVKSDLVKETFYSTRIINGHSIETLPKKVLEFRIEHRFGDIAGTNGGAQTMFGFDNSTDIRMAFEYGLTDKMMIGLGRSKGTGAPYRSLMDGLYKYRFLSQETGKMPVSAAFIGSAFYTYMKANTDPYSIAYFPKQAHRFAYSAQLNIARKFSNYFSAALMPTVVHRNYVQHYDANTIFAMGGGARIGINSTMAILLEYYHCFSAAEEREENGFKNSLGVAFEWITFGHNFTINLTNSTGFGEAQFIPYTYSDWLKGQFRLGFTIGRKFAF